MFKTYKICLYISILLLSGCSYLVKTPVVANYKNLEKIDSQTSRNQVAILLGGPQGKKLYGRAGNLKELDFYFGIAGKASGSGIDAKTGTAFISYQDESPVEVIYFNSFATGKALRPSTKFNIADKANSLWIGTSKINELIKTIGPPQFTGRRLNLPLGINRQIAYWDASQIQQNQAIKERWLLVGFDNEEVVQDFIWVSSNEDDLKNLGGISPEQFEKITKLNIVGFFPISETTGINVGAKIDPVQVDALIRSQPSNIKQIIDVIGKPSALGIKNFSESGAINLSNWSYSNAELEGSVENFIPVNATSEFKKKIGENPTFTIIKITQSRLMISHTSDGTIKEILWSKGVD